MIILDERNFLKPLLEDKGFQVFDFFEENKVMDLASFCALPLERRSGMVVVDSATLLKHPELQESFKTVMNTFLGVIFVHDHSNQEAHEWLQNHSAYLTKIVGEYSVPMTGLQWTMLSNQLQFFWSLKEEQKKLQRHMALFSAELEQVLEAAQVEMGKVKRVHEALVPKRHQEIKGVEFSHKYQAGEGASGEFYDLFSSPQKVWQVLVSSTSYLISSTLMALLQQHKEKEFSPEVFVQDALAEVAIVNESKKKKAEVHILVMEIDLNSLTLKTFGKHKAELHSQTQGVLEPSVVHQLAKGEKIIVFSPGFLFNWRESHQTDIHKFVAGHQLLPCKELMAELFIRLSQGQEPASLRTDSSIVMMEVNRHGIHQV